MSAEQLLDLRVPVQPATAPDGSRIAFVSEAVFTEPGRREESRIWVAAADGSGARQATWGPGTDMLPAWSPDGRALAFVSDRGHPGRLTVHLLEDGAEARPLDGPEGSVEQLAWSPDGRRLLVLAADPGSDRAGADSATRMDDPAQDDPRVVTPRKAWRRLHLVDVASGESTPVGHDGVNVWEFDWRGETAAAIVSDDPSESAWYRASVASVDIESGAVQRVYEPAWQVAAVAMSPDHSRVAFVEGFCSDRGILAGEATVAEIGGGHRTLATDLDVSSLAWRDDSSLWFAAVSGVENACGWIGLDGQAHALWRGEAEIASGWMPFVTAGPDGTLAAVHSSWSEPPEVRVLDGGRWRAVSALNAGASTPAGVTCERVAWRAADGLELEGLLVRPEGREGPLPTIVKVHGGPTAAYQWAFPHFGDVWPSEAGYACFMPNPRGSAGRGQSFARANLGDMGGGDLADILAGVDALCAAGVADPDRLAIMGGSYGGFMAAWAVTQTDRFKASVAIAAVTDWFSFHHTTNIGRFDELFLDGHPYDPGSDYFPRSPVALARKVTTPTLVMHGELDLCVPVSQGQELYQALADAGVDTALVIYPREGHGWREREHQLDGSRRILEWLARYL